MDENTLLAIRYLGFISLLIIALFVKTDLAPLAGVLSGILFPTTDLKEGVRNSL